MRKKDEQSAIKHLNQRIDAVIHGKDVPGDPEELELLHRLNSLNQPELHDEVLKKRLLTMIEEKNAHRQPGGFWGGFTLRPVLVAACSILVVLGIAGVLFQNVMSIPKSPIQVATREIKTDQPVDNIVNVSKESEKTISNRVSTGQKNSNSNNGQVAAENSKVEEIAPNSNLPAPAEVSPATATAPKKEDGKADLSYWAGGDMYFYFDSNERGLIDSKGTFMPKASDKDFNTESYDRISENQFKSSIDNPLSTFSIDVDTASYSNLRRFINQGQMPPKDAVRVEELINYFTYDYPEPAGDKPFSVTVEMGDCPWNTEHKLVRIGLQGKQVDLSNAPPNNLVFLLDVSGSMDVSYKLPLLKSSFRMLVQQMRPKDRVAIVVYAGAAGLILPSTSGEEKEKILAALDSLEAGGSTAGGEGIQLAYETARRYFVKNGNNRVILATDGDFNIGVSSDAEMERLIEQEREDGIFLSVLGFGMENYKDSKLEKLADKGNGNYYYIDNLQEARKVLVEEMGGTLITIAKDVKIQVEFNPARIRSYRQIGYENRALAAEDFEDDKKDAGELGAGHSVTALYEVELNDGKNPKGRDLKYQETAVKNDSFKSREFLTVKLRYKDPDGDKSKLIEVPLTKEPLPMASVTNDFRFAAAVAAFGMVVRDSEFKGKADFAMVLSLAESGLGKDIGEYRHAFLGLVKDCQQLMK